MKLDLSTILKNLDGSAMMDGTTKVTMEVALKHTLTTRLETDARPELEQDVAIIMLMMAAKGKHVELSAEQVTRIKTKVYIIYKDLVVVAGQMDYLLEEKKIPF